MGTQHSINEIRSTLKDLEAHDLVQICLRMAKYKKENKELLSYLLYESSDENAFIESILLDMEQQFEDLSDQGSYKLMKQIRKIGRTIAKPIKYSGLPATQIEILISYCKHLKPWIKKKPNLSALQNLYMQQIKKIDRAMEKLHEDLQYDYRKDLENLKLL